MSAMGPPEPDAGKPKRRTRSREARALRRAVVRALPRALPRLKFTDFPPWLRWWLLVGSAAVVWGLGQIWTINTRVTTLEIQLSERIPRPIAEELAPIKEKLSEISARLQALDAKVRDSAQPATPPASR